METTNFILNRLPYKYRPMAVLIGAILIQFSLGIMYTFGNLVPYIRSYFVWKVNKYQTTASLQWIQACMTSPPTSMLLGGLFERTIGGRKGAFIGLCLYTSGIALSYFTIEKNFYLFLLTFGLMNGFGQGIAYNAVLVVVHKWMPDKIGLVTGLVLAGFGCHGLLFAPFQTKFINPDGYLLDRRKGVFTQTDLLERVPKLFLVLTAVFALLQLVGLMLLGDAPRPKVKDESKKKEAETKTKSEDTLTDNICSWTFVFLFFSLLFSSVWAQTTNVFFKAFGQRFISSDLFLATILSVSAVANCLGRILWGRLADMTSYQVSMCSVSTFGAFLMWTLATVRFIGSKFLYMFWVALMFSCIGGLYTLIPIAANRCFGPHRVGLTYGFLQFAVGVAGVSASLISNWVLKRMPFESLFSIVASILYMTTILTMLIQRTKYGKPREEKILSQTHSESDDSENAQKV